MLADILPTSYEVGVLNGQRAARATPSPSSAPARSGWPRSSTPGCSARRTIVAIDLADARLEAAKRFGADVTINRREDAVATGRAS